MNVGVGKPESLATQQWKLHTVICFDVLPACDGQADRQTDTPFVTKSRSDIAKRDKNDENEKQSDNRVQFRLDTLGNYVWLLATSTLLWVLYFCGHR